MIKKYKLKCQHCQQEVIREMNRKLVTCWDCERLRRIAASERGKFRYYAKRDLVVASS